MALLADEELDEILKKYKLNNRQRNELIKDLGPLLKAIVPSPHCDGDMVECSEDGENWFPAVFQKIVYKCRRTDIPSVVVGQYAYIRAKPSVDVSKIIRRLKGSDQKVLRKIETVLSLSRD